MQNSTSNISEAQTAPTESLNRQSLESKITSAREALKATNPDEKIRSTTGEVRRRSSGVLELPNIDKEANELFAKTQAGLQAIVDLGPSAQYPAEKIEIIKAWLEDFKMKEQAADKTGIFQRIPSMRELFRVESGNE